MFFSEILGFLFRLFLFFQGILRPSIRPFSTNFKGGPTPAASSSALMANFSSDSVTYLTQRDAAEIDETLMGPLGFSVDQLMVCVCVFFFFISCGIVLVKLVNVFCS